ncbi:hypothetical protein GALL_522820 [mine drainage metagenome]|uniref:Uncharacterized protein n=1 Tax=mine drainage metagenome TaxID=410659 RepID=A0A1J5P5Z5_9ZZZZ
MPRSDLRMAVSTALMALLSKGVTTSMPDSGTVTVPIWLRGTTEP